MVVIPVYIICTIVLNEERGNVGQLVIALGLGLALENHEPKTKQKDKIERGMEQWNGGTNGSVIEQPASPTQTTHWNSNSNAVAGHFSVQSFPSLQS